MRAAISKIIGLMIFISAACAFADTKLPKCVIFTFGNCQGSLKYPNGDIYTGEFNYGQPNGAGKMTYVNGDLYAGNFFEGQKHGVGDYTWADGNRYIGQFIGGNLEGRGAYYFLSKNKSNPDKYVGDFKKNVFNGDGIYTYGNGAVVSGKFKDGKKVNVSTPVQVTEVKKTLDAVGAENELNKLGVEALNKVNGISENNQAPVNKELMALSDYSDGVINGNSLSGKNSISSNRSGEKGKIFLSGSLNSIGLTAVNIVNSSGQRVADNKLNGTMRNLPFSLGLGYNLGENYGVELGFKYHGDTRPDGYLTDQDSFDSSSFLLGGFFDIPISSGLKLGLKGGIQNTDSTYETFENFSNGTFTGKYTFTSNSTSYYYGIGLSYAVDGSNKIFIDWARFRSTFPNIDPSVSAEVNTDITQFGIRHSF